MWLRQEIMPPLPGSLYIVFAARPVGRQFCNSAAMLKGKVACVTGGASGGRRRPASHPQKRASLQLPSQTCSAIQRL